MIESGNVEFKREYVDDVRRTVKPVNPISGSVRADRMSVTLCASRILNQRGSITMEIACFE